MRNYRRGCLGFLILLVMLTSAFAAVSASGDDTGTLRIEYMDGNAPVAGAEFSALRVADILPHGQYRVAAGFESCAELLHYGMTNDAWEKAAVKFAEIITAQSIQSDRNGKTGTDGTLDLTGLSEGVYLIQGNVLKTSSKIYRPQSFLAVVSAGEPLTVTPKYETELTETKAVVTVKKRLTLDGRAVASPYEIFYVALFFDKAHTQLAEGPLPIEFIESSEATVVFTGLDEGTAYYMCETDMLGNAVEHGEVRDVEFTAKYPNGHRVLAGSDEKSKIVFENTFPELPAGYYWGEDPENETEPETESEPESEPETPEPDTQGQTETAAGARSPQTGDTSASELWIALLLLSAAALAGCAFARRRKSGII